MADEDQPPIDAEFVPITDLALVPEALALAPVPPLTEGLHFDVPHDRYHSDPCPEPSLSASTAKRLAEESALEGWYFHPRLGKAQEDGTPATRGGSLIDMLLFGGGPIITVIPYDGYQSKAAKQLRDDAIALGKVPVIEKKYDDALTLVTAVQKRLLESRGFTFDGQSQVTMVWRGPGGIWCRGRIDHLKTLVMYDLKWVESAAPAKVQRHVREYGLDIQATAYCEGMGTLYPERAGEFVFQPIFIQNRLPLNINMSPLHESMHELGKLRWRRAQRIWTACTKSGQWPDHGDKTPIEATKFQIEEAHLADFPVGGSPDVDF